MVKRSYITFLLVGFPTKNDEESKKCKLCFITWDDAASQAAKHEGLGIEFVGLGVVVFALFFSSLVFFVFVYVYFGVSVSFWW